MAGKKLDGKRAVVLMGIIAQNNRHKERMLAMRELLRLYGLEEHAAELKTRETALRECFFDGMQAVANAEKGFDVADDDKDRTPTS